MSNKDGGSAFPQQPIYKTFDGVYIGYEQGGMSLRTYIAIKAMQGMLSCQDFMNEILRNTDTKAEARDILSYYACKQADSMLEMLNGKSESITDDPGYGYEI